MAASKPTLGIFGLTGCAGDQLVMLNCEDQLLDLARVLDLREFLMASSANDTQCELDVALVEGAVMSRRDEERLRRIRQRSKTLVAVGTCAVWGGVAAGSNGVGRTVLIEEIYGAEGRAYDTAAARALSDVVKVDCRLTGCPIEKDQFLATVMQLLNGDPPLYPEYPVCAECRMRENNCLLIENGEVCCGPLTVAGCNARCPELAIACVGCRGPARDCNAASALEMFSGKGITREAVARKLRTFAPAAMEQREGVA
jgi:coenzyme F420-reducing hydrogenase gamma subunit